MNSLNLRVSTVKTGENIKKNAEIRATLIAIPKHYELSEAAYCVAFKNAESIPEQVTVVKNVFKSLSDASALQFLTDLYFYCPLKHPVRNQIAKLLITAAHLGTCGVDDSSIANALASTLQRLLEEIKSETESIKWNASIISISGCFENFSCGLQALKQCISGVFPFLCQSLQKYSVELGVLSSPSVRNEYYLYIHNSIRLILSCLQEFSTILKELHAEQLKQLNELCKQIINDDEVPMDPRTNSGIFMAQNAKLFGEYESFIQQAKLTKNANEIALSVGIVNTFDQHDFQQMSADIRDICSKIEGIANAHAIVPNILLCAARALYQVSKVIYSFELKSQSTTDDAKLILRKLLIFAFGYLEHHMDSVRHICKDLLRNIVATAKKINFEFLLQKIYDACNSERLSLSMKCVVLQQAAQIMGAAEIIQNCPELFTHLFSEHLGRDFIVNNLFESLMSVSHKELSYDDWLKLWIEYLLRIAVANDERLADVEILLVKAVKCEPKIVQHIMEQHENSKIPISTKLSALWAVRKSGIKMDNFNEIMQKFSKSLLLSILSNSDETRIMALRLLVETHKTTELLTIMECQHLLTYLEYNANCQSPATRQKTLSLLSKVLIRCELNLLKVLKDNQIATANVAAKQPKPRLKSKPTPTPTPTPAPTPTPILQLKFLQDFMRILVMNLFDGANFSRRSVSLQLLEQCVHVCINCNLNLEDEQLLPQNAIPALVEMLYDSYEANKELAVNILKLIENRLDCSLVEKYNIQIDLLQLQALLTSVRPTDSVTGAYQLEFYCNRLDSACFGDFDLTKYSPIHYAALRWLLLELKVGLRVAKQSILQACKLNPLYGLLFAIKHLLKQLEFKTLALEISWRILIAELIMLCKELTAVVAPIVNSSSPEGHLPNDFSDLPADLVQDEGNASAGASAKSTPSDGSCKILSSKNGKLNLATVKTTPQMVLLCAWRTVKEVSLILGDIVLRSPIQYSKLTEQFLLTKEQILEIGEHFKELLSETKHRGAFEQAYVGFSKLCCRLWRVEAQDLAALPMQWLRELVSLISKDEQSNEKICATRRSAGLPFMIQALITSELQVGTSKSLFYCMSNLLVLCGSSKRSTEARTHALNILRALFRCSDLNEAVGEYISDGVMTAIRSYDADTWSEKNSATLLFAALITRIFGVQRTKDSDNLNIRNKMTGRVFFLRYPKLYDFFLEQMQTASTLIEQQQKAHKLHPLLLILSRLYPSALEGTESNLRLTEFVPYIAKCAACPELQTRYLAAKAVVALVSKDAVSLTILKKCSELVFCLDNVEKPNLNTIHGQLLQILFLLKSHKTLLDEEIIGDIACTLVTFHERTHMRNAVILKVILDIFTEILNGLTSLSFDLETKRNLLYFSTQNELEATELSYFYVVLRKSFYIYNLHALRLTLPFGALSDYLLNPPLIQENVTLEQAETCLNIILLVLLRLPAVNDEIAEFEISGEEMQFVQILSSDVYNDLGNELRQSKALHFTLKELTKRSTYYPECTMKAYAILSLLDKFDFTLSYLIKESKKHTGDVKSALTMCVERLILQEGVEYKISQQCLEYLTEISQAWHPDYLRLRASKILGHIALHYPRALEKKKLIFLRLYIGLMLSLLMDDDYDIRDNTAKIVLKNLPDNIGMENVVSTMAQRLFLQLTADILLANKADDSYIIEVFKIIANTLSLAAKDEEDSNGSQASNTTDSLASNDLEVFDKNESNVFGEPLKAISDSIVVFKNTFSERTKVLSFITEFKLC